MNPFPPGVCRFCGITDAEIDGDRRRWFGPSRTVCDQPGCIRAHYAERDRAEAAAKKTTRRRTPGEIHQLMLEERRARRRQQRQRGKGRAA